MGYACLFFALVGGLVKGFAGKRVSNDVGNFKDCFIVNLFRMLFCMLLGLLLIFIDGDAFALQITWSSLPVYIFSALSMTVFCVSYMLAYKVSAYMYLSIFGMLGTVITSFLGYFIYDEEIGTNKLIGMLFILIAVIIMSKYNRDIKHKISKSGILILIIAALSSSFADFSQKIYINEIGQEAMVFNFYTYAIAALLILAVLPFIRVGLKKENGIVLYDFKHILIYGLISVGLYVNFYSKTLAAGYLDSSEIYPVLQGANLIASAVLAHILLKEKITKKSIIGMLCAFIGLVIMHAL